MALFSSQKNTQKNTSAKRDVKDAKGKLADALLTPWLSEKALISTEKGVYAFHVSKTTTKRDVILAVKKIYNVTPRKVTMVNLPAKKVSLRTRRGFGMRPARRKAYVHLVKGDTIQFG